jgi:uncharacterized metal-binding protein
MSDGITHARYAVRAATVVTVTAVGASLLVHPVAAGLIVGAWGAWLAGPDLDHHMHTEDEARIFRYNRMLGRLWSLYWWPYQKMIPHRGRSHTLPDGTADRFLLLFWPLIVASLWLTPTWGGWVVAVWAAVLIGQMAVDAVHLWLDGLI